MTNHAARRPFSPDPLMAEAKRRARQRRLLISGVLALIVAGVVGGLFAWRSSGPSESARAAAVGPPPRGAVGLVEAKGPAFPVRTFVLTLRNNRQLMDGDVKLTENGGSVVNPTLIPTGNASGGQTLSNEYLLQYLSLQGPDKTIRVQAKVKGEGTAVAGYTSPALP